MKKTFLGFIVMAAVGLPACGDSHALTAPSLLTEGITTNAASTGCSGPNCVFTATPFSGGASTWKGTTTPNAVPTTGHKGILEMDFAAPFALGGGATLSWSRFNTGSKADCTITNNIDSTVIKLPSCDDGSYPVNPHVTTVYTFTDDKNDPPSKDPVQTATVTVVVPDTVNVTARWKSDMGPGDDDPGVTYQGTASGPFTQLQVDAASQTFCGLSGNRNSPANHFHATMNIVDSTHIRGTYEGVACTVDQGTFTLTKQ
jgi:hypothetical protein